MDGSSLPSLYQCHNFLVALIWFLQLLDLFIFLKREGNPMYSSCSVDTSQFVCPFQIHPEEKSPPALSPSPGAPGMPWSHLQAAVTGRQSSPPRP